MVQSNWCVESRLDAGAEAEEPRRDLLQQPGKHYHGFGRRVSRRGCEKWSDFRCTVKAERVFRYIGYGVCNEDKGKTNSRVFGRSN